MIILLLLLWLFFYYINILSCQFKVTKHVLHWLYHTTINTTSWVRAIILPQKQVQATQTAQTTHSEQELRFPNIRQDPDSLMTLSVTVFSPTPEGVWVHSTADETASGVLFWTGGDSFVCRPGRAFRQLKVHLCPTTPPQPLFSLQSFNDWRICR